MLRGILDKTSESFSRYFCLRSEITNVFPFLCFSANTKALSFFRYSIPILSLWFSAIKSFSTSLSNLDGRLRFLPFTVGDLYSLFPNLRYLFPNIFVPIFERVLYNFVHIHHFLNIYEWFHDGSNDLYIYNITDDLNADEYFLSFVPFFFIKICTS